MPSATGAVTTRRPRLVVTVADVLLIPVIAASDWGAGSVIVGEASGLPVEGRGRHCVLLATAGSDRSGAVAVAKGRKVAVGP